MAVEKRPVSVVAAMRLFRSNMIQTEPPTRMTMSTAVKTRANRFSGADVFNPRCRKNLRWTRICNSASRAITASVATGVSACVAIRANAIAVSISAKTKPIRHDRAVGARFWGALLIQTIPLR